MEQSLGFFWGAIFGQLCDEMLDQRLDPAQPFFDSARVAAMSSVRDIGEVLADTRGPTTPASLAARVRRSRKHAPNLPPLAFPATPSTIAELFPRRFPLMPAF
jgi:hypothetical protein